MEGDLLVEVKRPPKDGERLNSAFRDVVGGSRSIHHLDRADDPTAEAEGVKSCSHELPTRGADSGGEGVDDKQALQRHKKGLHQTAGNAVPHAAQSDPHFFFREEEK